MERLDRPGVPRRPRPRRRQPRGAATRGPAPTRCSSATSTQVQVKASADDGACPTTCPLAVVEPGRADATETESRRPPARAPPSDDADTSYDAGVRGARRRATATSTLQAAAQRPPQPTIFTRAQWGADESDPRQGSLRYGSISAGFVHHTVNANDYTRGEVPGHPAQHLRLPHEVPRLERHRLQLPRRPVRPDLGGPLRRRRPPGRRRAHPRLQRLRVRDVGDRQLRVVAAARGDAPGLRRALRLEARPARASTRPRSSQQVGGTTFQAINGHRDAGSTACPGQYLYAKLPTIRAYAVAGGTPAPPPPPAEPTTVTIGDPAPQSNLVGDGLPRPRRPPGLDGRGFIVPTGGLTAFAKAATVSTKGWKDKQDVARHPRPHRRRRHRPGLHRARRACCGSGPARATAASRPPPRSSRRPAATTLVTAVGDLDGDGRNDLVARPQGPAGRPAGRAEGRLQAGRAGQGHGQLRAARRRRRPERRRQRRPAGPQRQGRSASSRARATAASVPGPPVPGSWGVYNRIASGADFNGDGRPDLVARRSKGAVFVLPVPGRRHLRHAGRPGHQRPLAAVADAGPATWSATLPPTWSASRTTRLVVVAQPGHLRPRRADRHRRLLRRRRPAAQRRRLERRRRRRRDRPPRRRRRCGSTAATAPAGSDPSRSARQAASGP